jgi:hypothetical protein
MALRALPGELRIKLPLFVVEVHGINPPTAPRR